MLVHGEYLRAITRDDLLVYHLEQDYTQADLEPVERAMLEYAIKLNGRPGEVGEQDLEPLRAAGFDDIGIMDIVMVVSLFNFMNRVSDGLGAQTEASMEKSRERGEKRAQDLLQQASTPSKQAQG
ncbi:MAG: peroxidase [SAR324 cluster bacterium]|nr:peroxidase [SAR324 cluster bacterium]